MPQNRRFEEDYDDLYLAELKRLGARNAPIPFAGTRRSDAARAGAGRSGGEYSGARALGGNVALPTYEL